MKIGICNLTIGSDYKEITKYSRTNKIEYCAKHGYYYIEDESCYDDSKTIPWSKILLLIKYIENFDYIVWIDSDIYIMNNNITIESIINKHLNGRDIIVGSDWKMINTGIMIIKNSEFSKNFLKKVYDNYDIINDKDFIHKDNEKYHNHEQGSFIYLYDNNEMDSQFKIVVTEPTILNSYWYNYDNGHFVLHYAGFGNMIKDFMHKTFPNRKHTDTDESYNNRMIYIKTILVKEFRDSSNRSKS